MVNWLRRAYIVWFGRHRDMWWIRLVVYSQNSVPALDNFVTLPIKEIFTGRSLSSAFSTVVDGLHGSSRFAISLEGCLYIIVRQGWFEAFLLRQELWLICLSSTNVIPVGKHWRFPLAPTLFTGFKNRARTHSRHSTVTKYWTMWIQWLMYCGLLVYITIFWHIVLPFYDCISYPVFLNIICQLFIDQNSYTHAHNMPGNRSLLLAGISYGTVAVIYIISSTFPKLGWRLKKVNTNWSASFRVKSVH